MIDEFLILIKAYCHELLVCRAYCFEHVVAYAVLLEVSKAVEVCYNVTSGGIEGLFYCAPVCWAIFMLCASQLTAC